MGPMGFASKPPPPINWLESFDSGHLLPDERHQRQ
jgi:hypothetical protein